MKEETIMNGNMDRTRIWHGLFQGTISRIHLEGQANKSGHPVPCPTSEIDFIIL
jgi:hypothetical protein